MPSFIPLQEHEQDTGGAPQNFEELGGGEQKGRMSVLVVSPGLAERDDDVRSHIPDEDLD